MRGASPPRFLAVRILQHDERIRRSTGPSLSVVIVEGEPGFITWRPRSRMPNEDAAHRPRGAVSGFEPDIGDEPIEIALQSARRACPNVLVESETFPCFSRSFMHIRGRQTHPRVATRLEMSPFFKAQQTQ